MDHAWWGKAKYNEDSFHQSVDTPRTWTLRAGRFPCMERIRSYFQNGIEVSVEEKRCRGMAVSLFHESLSRLLRLRAKFQRRNCRNHLKWIASMNALSFTSNLTQRNLHCFNVPKFDSWFEHTFVRELRRRLYCANGNAWFHFHFLSGQACGQASKSIGFGQYHTSWMLVYLASSPARCYRGIHVLRDMKVEVVSSHLDQDIDGKMNLNLNWPWPWFTPHIFDHSWEVSFLNPMVQLKPLNPSVKWLRMIRRTCTPLPKAMIFQTLRCHNARPQRKLLGILGLIEITEVGVLIRAGIQNDF
jgi:hypothetical protein